MEESRKKRAVETAQKRAERLQRDAEHGETATKADDANVQRMIERNIRDHGA